jgi:hypothetical protein
MTLDVHFVVAYPREAEVGEKHLLTVDLRVNGGEWPYGRDEEYPLECIVDASPGFWCRSLSGAAVVLHKFGGTYGPAEFLLTAVEQVRNGRIRVTLVNRAGLRVKVLKFDGVHVVPKGAGKKGVSDARKAPLLAESEPSVQEKPSPSVDVDRPRSRKWPHWMEIEIELAGHEIRVTLRGSRGERPVPYSLGPEVTRERLARFARDVGRAVQRGQPLARPLLGEAQALHEAIHQSEFRELEARLLAASEDNRLLQRLFVHDSALQAVPWEALCRPGSTQDFWGSSPALHLARGVVSSNLWDPRKVSGAVRVLAVAPSSDESALLSLKQALSESIESGAVEWLDPIAGLQATKRVFFNQLRRSKIPHVLHFLGDVGVDAQNHPTLRLADDEDGEEDWIKAESLAHELSASFGRDLRLIVLEACEGAKPGAFGSAAVILAKAGADAVVAHLWPVKADVARLCSTAFYRALTAVNREVGDVVASLGAARRTLLLTSAEGFSPVVYLRGASSVVFDFSGRRLPGPVIPKPAGDTDPALQRLLEGPFTLFLGDRWEDRSALRERLVKALRERGDTGAGELSSLSAIAQRFEMRFGRDRLMLEGQHWLRVDTAPGFDAYACDAIAQRLQPGVHISLSCIPWLEQAISRLHPDKVVHVLLPAPAKGGAPVHLRRSAGRGVMDDWEEIGSQSNRFDTDTEIVVLRPHGGFAPDLTHHDESFRYTEDDHDTDTYYSGFEQWNALAARIRTNPALLAGVSWMDERHRRLLRWLFGDRDPPMGSVMLGSDLYEGEYQAWTRRGVAAVRRSINDVNAQLVRVRTP